MIPQSAFRRHVHAGYSLLQVMVAVILLGLLTTYAIMDARGLIGVSEVVVGDQQVAMLNRVGDEFIAARGVFTPSMDANEALLLMQTPVDETSKRVGVGNFTLVDPRWVLQAVGDEYKGARVTYQYDAGLKRPQWKVAQSGSGFRIVSEGRRTAPAPANWSARVATMSNIGALQSKWAWDYEDVSRAKVVEGFATGPAEVTGGATLDIIGPDRISSVGTYYWDGSSNIAGTLSIALNGGAAVVAAQSTMVHSSDISFSAGARGQVLVTVNRTEGGTVSKLVPVDIPSVPVVSIAGPDLVATADPVTWTAASDVKGNPLAIVVEGLTAKAMDVNSVTSESVRFLWGTEKTITVTASSVNASGVGSASKVVTVKVPEVAQLEWELDGAIAGGKITAPGTYTFVLKSVDVGAQPAVTGTLSAKAMPVGRFAGNSATADGLSAPVSITLNPGATESVAGVLTLDGSILSPRGVAASKVTTVQVEIPPSKVLLSWTATLLEGDPDQVDHYEFMISNTTSGEMVHVRSLTGGASWTTTYEAGVGRYTVSATVTMKDGVTNAASVNQAEVEVIP